MNYFECVRNISNILTEHCDVSKLTAIRLTVRSPFTYLYFKDKESIMCKTFWDIAGDIWKYHKRQGNI